MPIEPSLTREEILRYSRHLIMPEVAMKGQLKLKSASVLLVGTGGLGAPALGLEWIPHLEQRSFVSLRSDV